MNRNSWVLLLCIVLKLPVEERCTSLFVFKIAHRFYAHFLPDINQTKSKHNDANQITSCAVLFAFVQASSQYPFIQDCQFSHTKFSTYTSQKSKEKVHANIKRRKSLFPTLLQNQNGTSIQCFSDDSKLFLTNYNEGVILATLCERRLQNLGTELFKTNQKTISTAIKTIKTLAFWFNIVKNYRFNTLIPRLKLRI